MFITAKEMLFSTGILFSKIFSKAVFFPEDFVKFKHIFGTWKMNLLFSRFSTTRGNPDYL